MSENKKERLDKIISNQTGISRSDIKKMMKKGLVTVDGEVVKDQKNKYDPALHEFLVDGRQVFYEKHMYIMLNKPEGYVSAVSDREFPTVIDIISEDIGRKSLFPAGRLDVDTTGLLIITDDGKFSHKIMSPKKDIEKVYHADIDKNITPSDIAKFKEGVILDDKLTKPAKLSLLEAGAEGDKVEIVITEGKYHQVKRMIHAIGGEVLALKRVQIGGLKLDESLSEGDYRLLTESELEQIFS